MTERLTETQIHEWLDTNGYLEQSHGDGCYSIELHVPNDPEQAWHNSKDVSPPESGFFDAIKEQGPRVRGSQPAKRVRSTIRSRKGERPATQHYAGVQTSTDARRRV